MRSDSTPQSPGPETPFDPGLQLERTALAWRRTAMTCCVGALLAMRMLPARLGSWVLPVAAVLATLSILTVIAAHHRYRTQHRTLTSTHAHGLRPQPGGVLPCGLATLTAVLGVVALAAIL